MRSLVEQVDKGAGGSMLAFFGGILDQRRAASHTGYNGGFCSEFLETECTGSSPFCLCDHRRHV